MSEIKLEPKLEQALEQDGDFHTPLERVNFEAGMLLGVEATQHEQAYHRRRLNRHRYWFHGAGTLLGLAVKMEHDAVANNDSDVSLRLLISPGIGIDGLGREVMSYEPYCINLRDWLEAQLTTDAGNQLIQDGLEAEGDAISLLITMRYHPCPTGLQPVMARKVNAGTDPVQPSRTRDSLLLEIIPGLLPEHAGGWPWRGHRQSSTPLQELLSDAEKDYLTALPPDQRQQAQLQGKLVYGLPAHNRALEVEGDLDELSRTLLAHLRIPLRVAQLPVISPIVNPNRIEINNLVRPFINTADQLMWLKQQEVTP